MDKTKFDTIYALTEGVREAALTGSPDTVYRLAHAIQCVMTDIAVYNEDLNREDLQKQSREDYEKHLQEKCQDYPEYGG